MNIYVFVFCVFLFLMLKMFNDRFFVLFEECKFSQFYERIKKALIKKYALFACHFFEKSSFFRKMF